MSYIDIYILFALNLLMISNFVRSNEGGSELLNRLLKNYDKTVRPNKGGESVNVEVTIYIINVDTVSEEYMEYSLHMYFRQKWTDPRLAYSSFNESINIPSTFSDKLWLPDTFFSNEKSSNPHDTANTNTFMRLKPNGELFMSTKRSITLACHMDLIYFPMDTQECLLTVESYAFNAEEVTYNWEKGPQNSVGIDSGIHLTNFYISGYHITSKKQTFSSGSYSYLQVRINFSRSISAYFFHVYIPSALIALISYMSLWINIKYSSIRVLLGMTSIIAMILIIYNPFASPTKSAYTKSLDIYMGICLFIVFAIVLEFIVVLYLHQKRKNLNEDKQDQVIMDDDNTRWIRIIDRIEYFSKIGFLVFFLLFVILYWIISKSLAKTMTSN